MQILLLPTAIDYITDKYFEGLVKWLKGAQVPMQSGLLPDTDENGEYCLKVKHPVRLTKPPYGIVQTRIKAKYFRKAKLVKSGEYYVAKLDLYEKPRGGGFCSVRQRSCRFNSVISRNRYGCARQSR